MISLRTFVPSSVVAALFLALTGCGDLTSNPVRGLRPGDASTDGKVGCTGNACKGGDIDARVLLDKSGNAIFVVRTGTFDPVTGVATPNGYFQTVQYKVYNAAGKQVLVEKPLCQTVAEGEELIRLAAERNLILMVGQVFLFNNGILKLKEKMDALKIECVVRHRDDYQASGGNLNQEMVAFLKKHLLQ